MLGYGYGIKIANTVRMGKPVVHPPRTPTVNIPTAMNPSTVPMAKSTPIAVTKDIRTPPEIRALYQKHQKQLENSNTLPAVAAKDKGVHEVGQHLDPNVVKSVHTQASKGLKDKTGIVGWDAKRNPIYSEAGTMGESYGLGYSPLGKAHLEVAATPRHNEVLHQRLLGMQNPMKIDSFLQQHVPGYVRPIEQFQRVPQAIMPKTSEEKSAISMQYILDKLKGAQQHPYNYAALVLQGDKPGILNELRNKQITKMNPLNPDLLEENQDAVNHLKNLLNQVKTNPTMNAYQQWLLE